MTNHTSIANIARMLHHEHTAVRTVMLQMGELHFLVRSNSDELLDKLRAYFKDFVTTDYEMPYVEVYAYQAATEGFDFNYIVKTPDAGKTKVKEEYFDFPDGRVVRKRLTGMLFFFGGKHNIAIGDCLANDNQVINFINNRYIDYMLNHGWLLGHAAGVGYDDMGMAFAGVSGAGKSTLALHVMNHDTAFVSNDRLLIQARDIGVVMSGVAKMPRINPGTILNNPTLLPLLTDEERARFQALSKDELWELEHKFDGLIHEIYGEGRFKLFQQMRHLVILTWGREGQGFSMEEVDIEKRTDLLDAFIKSPGLFFQPTHIDPQIALSKAAYLRVLKKIRVWEITGGIDFEKAATKCARILINENELL